MINWVIQYEALFYLKKRADACEQRVRCQDFTLCQQNRIL